MMAPKKTDTQERRNYVGAMFLHLITDKAYKPGAAIDYIVEHTGYAFSTVARYVAGSRPDADRVRRITPQRLKKKFSENFSACALTGKV